MENFLNLEGVLNTSARNIVLYIAIIIALRFLGRKGLAQISLADIVLLLVITRAVYNDLGVEAGLGMIFSLSILNYIIDYLTHRSRFFQKLVEGDPAVIIENGKVNEKEINRQRMNMNDVMKCIRQKGFDKVEQVKLGIIETDGSVSVIPITR